MIYCSECYDKSGVERFRAVIPRSACGVCGRACQGYDSEYTEGSERSVRYFDNQQSKPAYDKCDALGLHPIPEPLGDTHHTEADFSPKDEAIGEALAYFMGTMYSDVNERWFYYERSSINEWARVARALRVHGLKIVDVDHSVTRDESYTVKYFRQDK